MIKKWTRWIIFFLGLAALWQLTSVITDNSLICPSLAEIAGAMSEQLQSPQFFTALLDTLLRAAAGVLISFVSGVAAAAFCFRFPGFSWIFEKTVTVLQSIPNVAYIILLLFWTGRNEAVILVSFFLLFPIVFRDFHEGLRQISEEWKEVFLLYPQPVSEVLKQAAFPLLRPILQASLKSACSLGLKSVVMAEILASVSSGMGRQLQSARLGLNFAGVLGWVIWLVLISLLIEQILDLLFRKNGI